MHPQAFLKTFWRLELKPQVFVAMSFSSQYRDRYERIIAPSIEALAVNGVQLKPFRVDLSKTGDSILTDIVEGIAHSHLVLADVSTEGRDSKTGKGYRNGNVMYEVGIALACRHPSEVLLIRDDEDKFLFDVSSIPHMKVDFADATRAIATLTEALRARLTERQHVHDARVVLALSGLTSEEATRLCEWADYTPQTLFGHKDTGTVNLRLLASMPRLLDKQLIRLTGDFDDGSRAYQMTPLGHVVAAFVKGGLPKYTPDPTTE